MNLLKVPEYRENLVKSACFEEVPEEERAEIIENASNPVFAGAVFVPFKRVFDYDANIEDKDSWAEAMKMLLDAHAMMVPTSDGLKFDYNLAREFMNTNFSAQRLAFLREYAMTVYCIYGSTKLNSAELRSLMREVDSGWTVEKIRMALTFLVCGEMPADFRSSLMRAMDDEKYASTVYVPWARIEDDDARIEDRDNWAVITAQWMSESRFIFTEDEHIYFNVAAMYWWMGKNFSKERYEFIAQYAAFVMASQDAMIGKFDTISNYVDDINETATFSEDTIKSMMCAFIGGIKADKMSPEFREELKQKIHAGIDAGLKATGVPEDTAAALAETFFDKIDAVIDGTMSVDEFMTVFE